MKCHELKQLLSKHCGRGADQITIFVDNKILTDNQKPLDLGATEESNGLCYISGDFSFKNVKINQTASYDAPAHNTRIPISQKMSINSIRPMTSAPVQRPLTDEEYTQREINTGKYTTALKQAHEHSCLKPYFLRQLNERDSKLHGIFTRRAELLQQYIDRAETLPQSDPSFVLLTDADNEGILMIMEIGAMDMDSAVEAYMHYNKDANAWANDQFN